MKKGCVHIYTGCGKGKTTASMGLALRAALSGLRVCMFQFLKKPGTCAENRLKLSNFKIVCFEEMHPLFLGVRGKGKGVRLKKKILCDIAKAKKVIKSNRYDLIILDEIINCVSGKFISERKVLDIVKSKPKGLELVLTGRGATNGLIKAADYVTRCDKVKHPFDKGIFARRGIEY